VAIAIAGLLAIVAIAIYGIATLPDIVPMHVGPSGGIGPYGSKWQITAFFFIISVFLYALVTFISRYPYYFNYPVPIAVGTIAAIFMAMINTLARMSAAQKR
jgi:hypothetical protein